jgi:D-serine deaminase-like pyridoxal phosphate-dependent protein
VITSPTLVLDRNKTLENINKMSSKISNLGLKFRPHFKTHQSLEIGNWFREFPIDGITVSSLKMAKYFASGGWKSITVAFPFNILDIKEINALASKIDLRVLVVDSESAIELDKRLTSNVSVYIEIDPEYGRSGIHFNDTEQIDKLISTLNNTKKLTLHGFYSHAGHSYKCRSTNDLEQFSKAIIKSLSQLKNKYDLPICFGDTPSCSVLKNFGAIDELSPGNFVFYDWIQTQIGSCDPDEITIAMKCPVVAKYTSRNELLIHGGAVHFSKDYDLLDSGEPYFGQVVQTLNGQWGKPIENCFLKSVSQEHGIIKCTDEFFNDTKPGDIITILPIHSCLTADLMGSYLTTDNERISHLSEKRI